MVGIGNKAIVVDVDVDAHRLIMREIMKGFRELALNA